MSDRYQFGERLKVIRNETGKTQQELAVAVGLAVTQISRYESGRQEPSWSMAIDLANALGVTIAAFLPEDLQEQSRARRKDA